MKKLLFLVLLINVIISCKKENNLQLKFVDEFVLQDSLSYKNSLIGGLSGVDFANGFYYFVVDDSKSPRILKTKIKFKKDTISSINFENVIFLKDSTETFYNNNALDLESIIVDEKTLEIGLVSEGFIRGGKNPSIFKIDSLGKYKYDYKIPTYFNAESSGKPKHNASFESSSKSFDGKGFWVGMESVLESDGEHPTFKKTQSPVRFTYYNSETKLAEKQFAYQLDKIDKPAKGNLNLNGVTAILEYKQNTFFVVERAYQSGYGVFGNVVRIYKVTIDKKTTNTLEINSLKVTDFILATKELILDFDTLKSDLKEGFIDNIEGITLGPKLSNGNQSLLLVSDDNFQKFGKQLNQFLLLEIIEK